MSNPNIFDGAFGTYYAAISGENLSCEFANISTPAIVLEVQNKYVSCGIDAIKTNTYGANSTLCEDFDTVKKLIISGWQIAKKATVGKNISVFADIGYINSEKENLSAEYTNIVKVFISQGACNFLFETLSEFDVIIPAIRYIRENVENSYIYVSFAINQDGWSRGGKSYRALLKAAKSEDVDCAGMNCICGPTHMINLIKGALDIISSLKMFGVMPNAGYPSMVGGRSFFLNNAEYFSEKLCEIYTICGGHVVLGGCCGTTPEHIRLTTEKINAIKGVKTNFATYEKEIFTQKIEQNFFPDFKINDEKRKIIAIEIDPPLDAQSDFILEAARKIKVCGADLITLSDSPLSRTRADSVMTAAMIKRNVGIDVIPHVSCRDKNHIALKGTLISASLEGINKAFAVTGDPPVKLDNNRTSGVYTFNSFELISYINSMNGELFKDDAVFTLGGALNVNAFNFEAELERAKKKAACGASFFMTQPIYSEKAIENFLLAKRVLNQKLLAGIMPVAGYKNALFMLNEVSGIYIPPEMIEALRNADVEEAKEISLSYSKSIIDRIYDSADGFYLVMPLKKVNFVCELAEYIKKLGNNSC